MKICSSYIRILFLSVLVPNMLLAASGLKYQSVEIPFDMGKGEKREVLKLECAWLGEDEGGPSETSFSQIQPKTTCDKLVCDGMITCKGKINIQKMIACEVDSKCPESLQECINDRSISLRRDNQPVKKEEYIDIEKPETGIGK